MQTLPTGQLSLAAEHRRVQKPSGAQRSLAHSLARSQGAPNTLLGLSGAGSRASLGAKRGWQALAAHSYPAGQSPLASQLREQKPPSSPVETQRPSSHCAASVHFWPKALPVAGGVGDLQTST
jgi:hypothetical protein